MRKQKQTKECKLVSVGPQKGHPTADLDQKKVMNKPFVAPKAQTVCGTLAD
jgi:hypothetical protein